MGHLRPRGKRYQGRYSADGKEYCKTFDSEQGALNWVAANRAAQTWGDWIDPDLMKQPSSEYAGQWMLGKIGVSERTLVNIEGRLRNYVIPAFESRPIGSIRPDQVRAWVGSLTGRGLSPATVKAIFGTFAELMQQAEVDQVIRRNPCVGVKLPKQRKKRKEMHFLTPEQVQILDDSIARRHRALVFTASYAGLRAGELEALQVSDFNEVAATIDVRRSLSEIHGKLVAGPTKTENSERTVNLPRFLVQIIAEHMASYPSPKGYVFSAERGGPIGHRNFYARHFKPAVRNAGLPADLRFHDLRHTCAALLTLRDGHCRR